MLGSRRKLQATVGVRELSRASQEGIAAGFHQAILSTCHLPPSPWVITAPLMAVQAFPLGLSQTGDSFLMAPLLLPNTQLLTHPGGLHPK